MTNNNNKFKYMLADTNLIMLSDESRQTLCNFYENLKIELKKITKRKQWNKASKKYRMNHLENIMIHKVEFKIGIIEQMRNLGINY